MTNAEKVMPIIRAKARLHEYPFMAISSRMLLLLRAGAASNRREAEPRINQLYESSTTVARELGLPCSDVLLPYLNLLVAEHPSITPSFLETLELYDKHGDMAGFFKGDEGSMLRGIKRRRGPILCPQDVALIR